MDVHGPRTAGPPTRAKEKPSAYTHRNTRRRDYTRDRRGRARDGVGADVSINGPHEGAPLGGSSISAPGADFFAPPTVDLAEYNPGDVISTRTIPYHIAGLPLPVDVVQIV